MPLHPSCGIAGHLTRQETVIMEVVNGGQSNLKSQREATSGALPDSTRWETIPRWHITKKVVAEYLSIVSNAAETAINKEATDPVEEAAHALAAGFGAAMVTHGRKLNAEGYEEGDSEWKAYLWLPTDEEIEGAS
jgi:hypothetical protein